MFRELGHELQPFEDVRETILSHVRGLPAEYVPLEDGSDRVLAEDLQSEEWIPRFDNSAMDGYAVRAADIADASEDHPVTLAVVGEIAAGDLAEFSLSSGNAARIMTGAPVPPGADTVVPYEVTRFSEKEVTFTRPARQGRNIRRAGGDMRPGDVPVARGMRLRGTHLAVAATLGRARLLVTRSPCIALLSPGKELVEPWDTPGPGQIRNSNSYGLAAMVRDVGGAPEIRGIIEDSPEALRAAIRKALDGGADGIITTGGVSAGDYDFVQAVVREDGQPGYVFKTNMRPGKPQVFGLFGGVPFFGLPGNPASAIVSFAVFVRPALRKMLGEDPWIPPSFPVHFPRDFPYKGGRVLLLRARVEPDFESPTGGFRMESAGDQDSSFLAALAASNAIIQLPGDRSVARRGEVFPAQWIHAR